MSKKVLGSEPASKCRYIKRGIIAMIAFPVVLAAIIALNPDMAVSQLNWPLYIGLSVVLGVAIGLNAKRNHAFPELNARRLGRD